MSQTAAPHKATGGHRGNLIKAAVVVVAIIVLFTQRETLAERLPQFFSWVEGLGIWGPVVFAGGYAVATVAMVPGVVLTLTAGALFGLATGFATVFAGAALGATLAFLVSRYAARSWVEERLEGHDTFATIDRAVGEQGFKIAFLLRLSPVFPFNLLNYALGLTRISLRDYVAAHLGMLPGTLLYVYYGQLAGTVAAVASGMPMEERGTEYYILLALGLVAALVVTTIVTRIASRALKGITDEQ